jgi:PKD repeat protein
MTGSGSSLAHTYSSPGSYTAKLTVTDSASPHATIVASKIVNVLALIPPTLTVPGNQTVVAGSWVNFTVTAASLNVGGAVSLSATGLPPGATFDQTTGFFSWRPNSAQTGSHLVVFTATDSNYSSTPTSKPMDIQVNPAAPGGGSSGGNGGSTGGSNGSCTLCGIFPRISTNTGLLLVGGFLGLLSTLVVFTNRARISLQRTKHRMEIRRR